MKRLMIFLVVAFFLASCGKHPDITDFQLPIDAELLQTDSLMQHSPDSALQALLSCHYEHEVRRTDPVISTELRPKGEGSGDISSIFNESYRSLLLSEALYKNDNPQDGFVETHSRAYLQTAMRYFDSLALRYPNNDDITMLSARSHYMNGVGYYENDSVVEACQEYLHTLEIMERHFQENDFVGYKAKFIGLTYTRLGELFSDQFMIDNSIDCFKKSLSFIIKDTHSSLNIANLNYRIGLQYHEKMMNDSAQYYYNNALKHIPDTNNILYRDLVTSNALLLYLSGCGLDSIIPCFNNILRHAETQDEKLTRMLTVGCLFYKEGIYDSAYLYLSNVFQNSDDISSKLLSARHLQSICNLNDDLIHARIYTEFLAEYTIRKLDDNVQGAKLSALYSSFMIKQNSPYSLAIKGSSKWAQYVIIIVLFALMTFGSIFIKSRNKHHEEKKKLVDNLNKEQEKRLFMPVKTNSEQYKHFIEEPICKRIIETILSEHITSRDKYYDHMDCVMDDDMFSLLEDAVCKHYDNFRKALILNGIKKKNDLQLCYLYMFGFDDSQISVLKGRDFSTIKKQSDKLGRILCADKKLSDYIVDIL